jgi:transposase
MATPQKEPLRPLTPEEQGALERIAQATSDRVDRVRRAQALLAVARGTAFAPAARAAGFRSHSGVAKLVARFTQRGLAALSIAAGRGRRPTYGVAERAQIVVLAQQAPRRREDGTATWSLSTLQRRLRAEGLPALGGSTIRAVLRRAGSSYQRTRTWCPTGTAVRKRKAGPVQVVDPRTEEKVSALEIAYRHSESWGVPLWCQDEAGPYQAIPQAGQSWQPVGKPALLPHEYLRGGTAKLLTLFRPATGLVRARGVTQSTNAILHPWVQQEVRALLATFPPPVLLTHTCPLRPLWAAWLDRDPAGPLPPLRLILVWDNIVGHTSPALLAWLTAHGVLPLYTPLSGSWLNLAESVQRILIRRALSGQHPATAQEIIMWLEDTVAGWNAAPTPFVWDGPRRRRRERARLRRLGGSAAALPEGHSIAA